MTKTEYRKARRLYRDNGHYSLRWMDESTRATFEQLESGKDHLADRASIVAYCKRVGCECNVHHTQSTNH